MLLCSLVVVVAVVVDVVVEVVVVVVVVLMLCVRYHSVIRSLAKKTNQSEANVNDDLVHLNRVDLRGCRQHTCETYAAMAQSLADAASLPAPPNKKERTKQGDDFQELEKIYGLVYHRRGLMFDPDMRKVAKATPLIVYAATASFSKAPGSYSRIYIYNIYIHVYIPNS